MELIIHTDGGARGNPGPAAIGVVIEKINSITRKPEIISEFGKKIGETTNNVAEYTAVLEAIKWITDNQNIFSDSPSVINFFLDSSLVVNQLNGLFKVKDEKMRDLLFKVRILEQGIKVKIFYKLIPREQNTKADYQVNKAMDEK
jgi:ribonuclease HI